jgi:anti-sigma28 factor (negative regulator of flagellin synthesis)
MYLRQGVFFFNHLREAIMINGINNSDILKTQESQRFRSQRQEKQTTSSDQNSSMPEDRVSLNSSPKEILTYSIPQNSPLVESDFKPLQEMLVDIFEEQGIMVQIGSGDSSIDISDITPEKASELISEDGYLGIEQTSDRIVQFAISISGNDPEKLEELKASIEKGFQQASDALGGQLPDISMKTHDAIMDKLDAWAENSGISV